MTEHQRIQQKYCKPHENVCDSFCGIGPFVLPIAKKTHSFVFGNDLNPDSYQYLQKNVVLNKVESKVMCFNMCARDFVGESLKVLNCDETMGQMIQLQNAEINVRLKEKVDKHKSLGNDEETRLLENRPRFFSHYIMNLPNTAIEFLDAFIGIYDEYPKLRNSVMPVVHCHCFSSAEDKKKDVVEVSLKDYIMKMFM